MRPVVVVGLRFLLRLDHDRPVVDDRPISPAQAASRIGCTTGRHVDALHCAAPRSLGDFSEPFRTGKGPFASEIAALLERALQVSPINPTARLALAQLEPPGSSTTVSIRSLGLSRDVLSLAWSARRLLAAGEKEAALRMYGQSLSVAMSGESSACRPGPVQRRSERSPLPPARRGAGTRHRARAGFQQRVDVPRVVRGTPRQPRWSAWRPPGCSASKAGAKPKPCSTSSWTNERTAAAPGTAGPLTLAARAEAFALRSRWREADQHYRQAIELIDDDTIKRSWWFNLADIAFRLDDENQRQAALRAALAVAASDDITRRATEIQRATRRGQPALDGRQGKLSESRFSQAT